MEVYPLVNSHNYGKSPFVMGKSTISMAIVNSKLLVYQRVMRWGGILVEVPSWWVESYIGLITGGSNQPFYYGGKSWDILWYHFFVDIVNMCCFGLDLNMGNLSRPLYGSLKTTWWWNWWKTLDGMGSQKFLGPKYWSQCSPLTYESLRSQCSHCTPLGTSWNFHDPLVN